MYDDFEDFEQRILALQSMHAHAIANRKRPISARACVFTTVSIFVVGGAAQVALIGHPRAIMIAGALTVIAFLAFISLFRREELWNSPVDLETAASGRYAKYKPYAEKYGGR